MLASGSLLLGTELAFTGGIGLLGWLLAVYCIVDKHDPEQHKKLHLFDELVRASFVAVTMVAAVNIGFQIALHLPDVVGQRVDASSGQVLQRVDEAESALAGRVDAAREDLVGRLDGAAADIAANDDGHAQDLAGRIDDLGRALRARDRDRAPSDTFARALGALRDRGAFTRENVQRLADLHLAGAGIAPERGTLYLRLPGDQVWSCSFKPEGTRIYAEVGRQYQ